MKITIQTPDFKMQKKLAALANKNIEKLSTLSDRIIQADVLLKLEKSEQQENKICELKLAMPGKDLFVSRASNTFESAILKSVKAMNHQLKRRKDSADKGKRRGSVAPFEAGDTLL